MTATTTAIIRVLTISSLSGLLFAVGLRLKWEQIPGALRQSRLGFVLCANFVLVPALTVGVAKLFQLPTTVIAGMLLLGVAPFAPVVPVFVKMARGDLALAGALTAVFPFFCVVLTPIAGGLCFRLVETSGTLRFDFLTILLTLLSTITLPLLAGVGFRHWLPRVAGSLLRPLETVAEVAGAVSLVFVTVAEFSTITALGWQALLPMVLLGEGCLWIGYALGGTAADVRRVIAFGTSNRNIALALLVAIQSFPGTPIPGVVVGNGLVLIFLGLLHVAIWRFSPGRARVGA
jgi:BASS family bile acid:Na+ symporter